MSFFSACSRDLFYHQDTIVLLLRDHPVLPANSNLSKGAVFHQGEFVWKIVILVSLSPVFQKGRL